MDGKKLKKDKTFNYDKNYKENKTRYLESVVKKQIIYQSRA